MLADALYRLRALFRRSTVEHELDDELQFHLEHAIEKQVAAGMPRQEAVRRARLEFGGVEQVKEDCRDARGISLPETILQDLRYGLRTMRRTPVFSVTAIVTIALSIASLTTAFTLRYTMLFRPLPVERPGEIVAVRATRGRPTPEGPLSYADYVTFRNGTKTLSGLAAHYSTAPLYVSVNGTAKEVNGAVVSANYFPLLGISPALGRFFHDDEDRVPDRDRVAVLGHDFWRTWFRGSPDAVGATLKVNGVTFTVIGVAPATFVGLRPYPAQLYIPTMMLGTGYRWCTEIGGAFSPQCTILEMAGRLAPGRSVSDVTGELTMLRPEAWLHAKVGENSGIEVTRFLGATRNESVAQLVGILTAVGIVLLLVCGANLTGLLTAQGSARSHEFAIRLALGAARSRVVRQFLTESLMLAVIGGVAGVALSTGFVKALTAFFYSIDDEGHPLYFDFSLTPAIAFTAIVSAVAAACVFSAIPARRIARADSNAHPDSRTTSGRWSVGRWLLAAQAAIAVALVAVASLLTSSARGVVKGTTFESSHVALMRVRPRLMNYTPERAQQFQHDIVRRLSAVPGVESVSMVGVGAVLTAGRFVPTVELRGWSRDQRIGAGQNEIGPRYFETLRIPVLGGREFDDRDTTQSPPVAIVSESLARRLWPNGDAIGSTIVMSDTSRQVVGIVADVRIHNRDEGLFALSPSYFVYVPFWQNPMQIDSRLAIRVAGDPAAVLPALMREINRVDADVPIAETITLPMQLAGWMREGRLTAAFVGYAAGLAVLLTAIGLYGSLAFAVSRRTKEIGIRMALGAGRSSVLRLILGEGMAVALAGAVGGLVLAAAGTRLVTHLLFQSAAADVLFYAAAAFLVAVVGFVASLMPARRAAALEPLAALRHE
jgi:predicted permease